jgi:hypothetical protein
MHGRKKLTAPPTQEQVDAVKKKVDTYRKLGKLALKQVRVCMFTRRGGSWRGAGPAL